MIEKLRCLSTKSIFDVWKIINENGKGIVFITDIDQKLIGVVTDGDIRGFLLEKKGDFQSPLEIVMNKNFTYAYETDTPEKMIKKFSNKIKIIPIVNSEFKIVNYIEYSKSFNLPVAIPDLNGKELDYLIDAFLSTWISSSGSYIDKFEDGFSSYCGTKYGIAVANGTAALHLALLALSIGKGDEVIVPDLTFAATINAVIHSGATPVIVDVEEDSWCIDPNEIEKAITTKTRAIIPVHLYGQPADMDRIHDIEVKNKLYIIEDAAEAHGAEYGGKKVGSIGDIGCFSFYGNKVITTGEGGMCITNSEELANKIRVLKDHGMAKKKKYWHDVVGFNYRMTNLQASIGLAQIERFNKILSDRKKIEDRYKTELSFITGLIWQKDNLEKRSKISWLVCALVDETIRDSLIVKLKEKGIDTRPFFYSLGDMEIYKKYVFSNKISKILSSRGINFPTLQGLDDNYYETLKNVIMKNI